MLDRCYLTESVPVQLIWGSHDSVIPVSHARMAHSAMPGSQLEIFDGSGHFPFHDDPDRFVEVVETVHRLHRTRRLRPGGAARPAAHRHQRGQRSPDRSTPGSRCSTRWAPTSAAPPDRRPAGHSATYVASAHGHRRDRAAGVHRLRTATSAIRSASSTRALSTPATGSASPPNWVTAKRYSSTCRQPGRAPRSARIFTPATELPFAGHPTVGASWWLRDTRHADQHPAGARRRRAGRLRRRTDGAPCQGPRRVGAGVRDLRPGLRRRAPRRRSRRLPRRRRALSVDVDRSGRGRIRSRMFASHLGIRGGRGHRRCGGAHHRLPQPRPRRSRRARVRVIRPSGAPTAGCSVAGRVVNDGTKQID